MGVSIVLMLILMAAALILPYLLRGDVRESANDISKYGQWAVPEKYSRLLVFPENVPSSAENVQYFYKFENGWTRPMCQIYLSCTLSQEEYEAEKERLAGLSFQSEAGTLPVREARGFAYPGYSAIEGYDFCYEYALLDEPWNHIVYVYTMNTIKQDIKFDKNYLPDNYMEGFEELSYMGLDRFTMYGGYEGPETAAGE